MSKRRKSIKRRMVDKSGWNNIKKWNNGNNAKKGKNRTNMTMRKKETKRGGESRWKKREIRTEGRNRRSCRKNGREAVRRLRKK